MRILGDHCIHGDLVAALSKVGVAITKVSDKKLADASDQEIYAYAQQHKYTILTYDKDFGNIVRFNIRHSQGIVIVYIEGMRKEEIIDKTIYFFKNFKEKEFTGKLFLIEKDGIRIWPK